MSEMLRSRDIEVECIPIERSDERPYEENVEDAKQEKKAEIEPIKTDLSDFDLLFIGSPVWCGKPATPINTYLEQCEGLNGLNIVCFVTHGGGGPGKTFEIMERKLKSKGGKIVDDLSIRSDEVEDEVVGQRIEDIVSSLEDREK